MRAPNFVTQERIELKPDARRYEAGSHNLLGIVGLRAGIELLMEVELEVISRELWRKRGWFVPALEVKGYSVLQGRTAPENASAIITFWKEGADMAELHAHLERENVVTSLRVDRAGQRYVRLSPHFYNTDAELQRVLELI